MAGQTSRINGRKGGRPKSNNTLTAEATRELIAKQIQTHIPQIIDALIKKEETRYFEIWLNILDLAHRAREIYEKRSPEQKRLLLTHIFSNLMLKDKKIIYTLKKPIEIIAKRVQQKLDQKNSFEPEKTLLNNRQRDSFESLCPALLLLLGKFRTLNWALIKRELDKSKIFNLFTP